MAKKRDEEGMRQRLIEAARVVFSSKSPMEVTMHDVSSQAGLGKGTSYLYFKSKDELMIEMFRDCIARSRGALCSSLQDSKETSAIVLLGQAIDFTLEEVLNYSKIWGIWYQFLALASSAKYREAVLEIAQANQRRRIELVEKLIEQGKQSGEFRPDVDAHLTAVNLFALIDGFILQTYIGTITDFRATCRRAMEPVLQGIFSESLARQSGGKR